MKHGLDASFADKENGMTKADMVAAAQVATQLDEVIIFRSTGPWSRRWIERGCPSKNFHVKGKSSDWGPQAGFVPYQGIYSKVGHDPGKAKKGTEANDDGLNHHFAGKRQLALTLEELQLQRDQQEEDPPRSAVLQMAPVPDSKDYFLFAVRSGDQKRFAFRAVWSGGAAYDVFVYPENAPSDPKRLVFEKATPLEVMTSSEKGADNKPMTGDYDLMAVCPKWGNLHSRSIKEISKPGLVIGTKVQPGQTFAAGSNLDQVLDMRLNTGRMTPDYLKQPRSEQHWRLQMGAVDEHADMGNLTPRILRCINALNATMPNGGGAFRRVHHNAESHRNHAFGAVSGAEMARGECFPLTVFQPDALLWASSPTSQYSNVATLENLPEFQQYVLLLKEAGYFVPRNCVWGMSLRDGFGR
ncbi:MAG TPA: anthrax toxin-like adenylyl cyclase domain-containing protein [Pirellulales bacterium]|nr:anthrax toxin-like adenylyl cyclase domain-containing protein [Pirellulales bacterium]